MHRRPRRPSAPIAFIESLESRALLAADLAVIAASTASGAKTGSLTIKNTGTVNMSGPVTVTFTAKAGSGAAQTLGTKTVTLAGLKPNASLPVTGVSLKAPTGTGTFNITVKIAKAGDSVAANNSKAAGSVTIKGSGNTGGGGANTGETIFALPGAGTTLKFKLKNKLPGNGILGSVSEEGTFTDGAGHSGKYYFVLPATQVGNKKEIQILDLDFDSSPGFEGGQRRYHLTFTPASKRLGNGLNGKSITFTKTATGASAKADAFSTFSPNVYLKY